MIRTVTTIIAAGAMAISAPAFAADCAKPYHGPFGVVGSTLASTPGLISDNIVGGITGKPVRHDNACTHVACRWTTEYRDHVAYRVHMCRDGDGVWRRT